MPLDDNSTPDRLTGRSTAPRSDSVAPVHGSSAPAAAVTPARPHPEMIKSAARDLDADSVPTHGLSDSRIDNPSPSTPS